MSELSNSADEIEVEDFFEEELPTPPEPLVLGVLGSGQGSNFRAIVNAIEQGKLHAQVAIVVSDEEQASILQHAQELGISSIHIHPGKYRTSMEMAVEDRIADLFEKHGVNLVVLAGFMRILKHQLLERYAGRIVNIHPSLLPNHPGREAWRQAFDAGDKVAGATVHRVDSGVDTGEILAQAEVEIFEDDDVEAVRERIQAAEHLLYPRVLEYFAQGWLR